jgi:hypothetical protein
MSAYGDIRKPVGCTSTGRTMTGREPCEAAAPVIACSVYSPSVAISSATAASPPASHASCSAGSSHAPVARIEIPRGPVRRSTPRITSSHEWNTVDA